MITSLFSDNPILIKHLRTRLRLQQLIPLIIVVVLVSALFCWMGSNAEDKLPAFGFLFSLQCILLFLSGSCQVAGAVAAAREGGQLDFHRISPQSPLAMAVGYLVGAPIRELILFACTIPFMLPFFAIGNPSWMGFGLPVLLLAMLPAAFLWFSVALLLALIVPKPRNVAVLVAIIVAGAHLLFAIPMLQHFTVIPTMISTMVQGASTFGMNRAHSSEDQWIISSFFAIHIPYVILGVLHQLIIGIFCLYAAVRKLGNEQRYPISRSIALLIFGIFSCLLLGDIINPIFNSFFNFTDMANFCLYAILVVAIVLLAICTPGRSEIIKGIRHVKKLGYRAIPAWSDRAPNSLFQIVVTALSALFCFVGITIIYYLRFTSGFNESIDGASMLNDAEFIKMMAASLVTVGTTFFFGASMQYFLLRFRKQGTSYLALMLFFLWLLPLAIALVLTTVFSHSSADVKTFLSLTPLSSIALIITDYGIDIGINLIIAVAVPWLLGIGFFILSLHETRKLTQQSM